MSALSDFRQQLERLLDGRKISVARWSRGHSSNLLELATLPKPTVLYVKEFNVDQHAGFWGLTKNQVDRLIGSQVRWFALLLLRSSTSGYLITGQQVVHRIRNGLFELSEDGDYKVNEGPDLDEGQRIQSMQELLARIL
jgi:hypothetical protein